MRKSLQVIMLLKNFSTGVTAAVFTLVLLVHGATLQTVSLMIGAYSATVIIAEFPTGVFADRFGRKPAFVIAMALLIAGYGMLLIANSLVELVVSMVLQGLGRAFSSGSLDALAIDEAPDEPAIVRVTARLSLLETAGLALGALAGGALASIGTRYTANVGVDLGLSVILLCLTVFTVREVRPDARRLAAAAEPVAAGNDADRVDRLAATFFDGMSAETPNSPERAAAASQTSGLGTHLRECAVFMVQSRLTRMLFSFAIMGGVAMLALETYWQPALTSFSVAPWMLGVVSFLGFGNAMVGTRLAEKLLDHHPDRIILLLLLQKALYGGCLLLMAAVLGVVPFIMAYMLSYLFLGGSGVAESVLLNREASSNKRASILSLFSLLLQLGGLLASALGFIVTAYTDFHAMWIIGGGMMMLAAGVWALLHLRKPVA